MDRSAGRREGVDFVKELDKDSQKYKAPALEKGLEILEQLARQGAPMTTKRISAALHRSVSELFRMLQVLEFKGYIVDTSEGYRLTGKLFTMGLSSAPLTSLTDEALPHMRNLARRVRQSCHLAVHSEEQIVVIARVENPEYFGYSVRSGHRLDLTRSTSGVVLYAFQSKEIQSRLVKQIQGRRKSGLPPAFLAKVKTAQEQGYWSAKSDLVPSVVDIAAPVLQSGCAVASLTVPYIHQVHTAPIEKVIVQAKLAAAAISEALARNL